MSEAVVNRLSFNDDMIQPPTKKIRLSSEDDNSPCASLIPESLTVTQSEEPSASPKAPADNTDDDVFDPVQAILEVSRACKAEEEENIQLVDSTSEKSASKNSSKTNEEKEINSKQENGKSRSDSEDEIHSDSELSHGTKKSDTETTAGKQNGLEKSKKKNKSSHMRRNIKDILTHDQLDDLTIAARKEEEERRQRMNLRLKLLQEQQMQLLNETFKETPPFNDFNRGYQPRFSDDLLLKRLMRKKHITVSLDESGVPRKKENDEECILLSSDDEADASVPPKTDTPHLPQIPFNFNPLPFPFPSQTHSHPIQNQERIPEPSSCQNYLTTDEVIALSSGDEDDERKKAHLRSSRLNNDIPRISEEEGAGAEEQVESDDDCVIINPDDAEVDDKDECHQDLLNVPDPLGRVLVNVGHPDEDPDIFLPPQIAKIVKPHQIGGIRFLYDNVVESKNRYDQSSGFGCILAHAMGLGKTLQTVSFCDVFLRTSGKTVLIIVPINTIQNWLNEFNRYLPLNESNNSSNESDHSIKRRSGRNKSSVKIPTSELDAEQNSSDSALTVRVDCVAGQHLENIEQTPSETKTTPDPLLNPTAQSNPSISFSSLSSEKEEIGFRTFEVYLLNETVKSLQARENAIRTWNSKGGVLLIGYEMYRMLALKKLKKSSRKVMSLDHSERLAEAESLDKIYECLVNPGPDCVICDEGHRIKNSGAGISQALKAIKTKRRVVLTGYPLQNNLMEYWCMVDFVRPNYLGTKAEFSNMFERPIQNGQCADSTFEDKRLMKHRSHVLHSLLEGFVQRRSHLVLKNALPPKEEWVFLVRLTPIQLQIYREFINYLREDLDKDNASANPIKAFAVCCKIWNHPDVLWNVVKKNLDLEMDLDIDEVKANASQKPVKPKRGSGRPRGRPPLNGICLPAPNYTQANGISGRTGMDFFDDDDGHLTASTEASTTPMATSSGISLEWAKPLFEKYTPEVMENGVKFELLFLLIKETVAVGDKLLVFSQSLLTLDLIEVFLKRRLNWVKSKEYVRLDGSTAGLERERLIDQFNKSCTLKLFIISTRAGSLGINLVGANRVCIFDASWNPCHDSQAVCRVYRYGQVKPCHIYRFVADCTLEKRIYDRQVNKKGMADRIVDEMNPNTPFKTKDVSSFLVLQHDLLDKLPYIKCDLTLEKYSDPVLRNVLESFGNCITQEPFEHESLLIDQKHQKLSKSEKRIALRNYQKDKQNAANSTSYQRPSYAQYYSSIGTGSSYSSSARSMSSHSTSTYTSYTRSSESNVMMGGVCCGNKLPTNTQPSDNFERHIIALKSRGISVFPVEVHQDTIINDPHGTQAIFLKMGERVYLLVSQKGTYLRLKDKLLKVPFVGTDITQEQAEKYVTSVLHAQGKGRSSVPSSPTYPVEQKLPPSNSLMLQKNLNHLQISNSRSNTGGDIMMGDGESWSNGTSTPEKQHRSHHHHHHSSHHHRNHNHGFQQQVNLSEKNKELLHQLANYGAAGGSSTRTDAYSPLPFGTNPNHNFSLPQRSESNIQSLSRLTEAFCNNSPFSYAQSQSLLESSRWRLESKSEAHNQSKDMEVIKLDHSHSSNSSTSSNSRTNSPYSKSNWNLMNDGSNVGNTSSSANYSSRRSNRDSSYYTDFTITPLGSNSRSPSRSAKGIATQIAESVSSPWDGNNDSKLSLAEHHAATSTATTADVSSVIDKGNIDNLEPSLSKYHSLFDTSQFTDLSLINKMMNAQANQGPFTNTSTSNHKDESNNDTLRKLLSGSGCASSSSKNNNDLFSNFSIGRDGLNLFNNSFNQNPNSSSSSSQF